MALFTADFDFSTLADFVLAGTKLLGGIAQLDDPVTPGLTFNQSFASSTGFTYNSTKAEFVGGVLRQKVAAPDNSTFFANYDVDASFDAAVAAGSVTGTPTNAPTVSGGFLNLVGGTTKYVDYAGTANVNATNQIGAVNVGYKPNYTGNPGSYQIIFSCAQANGSPNNLFELYHAITTGNLILFVLNSVGATIASINFGAWSPVAGTVYEIELNWDFTAGATRLFINGVQFGATNTATGSRSTNIGLIRIGNEPTVSGGNASNFSLGWINIFSTIQHVANYTPVVGGPYTYRESKADLPIFTYTGPGSIAALTSLVTTEVGAPRYIAEGKYWTGSAWAASDGTYAQANPKATVLANLGSLAVLGETSIAMSVVFPDAFSASQSSVDDVTLTYSGNKYSSTGTIATNLGLNAKEFLDITASGVVTPAGTSLKAAVYVDGVLKYWNGSAIVNSDGTLSQCNTFAELATNATEFIGDVVSTLDFYLRLETSDPNATPQIDAFTVDYEFGGSAVVPTTCLVWGYYRGPDAVGKGGVKLKFMPVRPALAYMEAGNAIIGPSIEVETSSGSSDLGYFETPLIRSSAFENGPKAYQVKIIDQNGERTALNASGQPIQFTVPDALEKEITDLLAGA